MELSGTIRLMEPGTVIAGRFKLIELLGTGGMGSVWKAEHLSLKSLVAVKIISADGVLSESQLSRFMREAQSAAALRSPHVVQILDHGVNDGIPWIAMELLEGESLASRITRLGRLGIEQTARILTHISRAVTKAHEAGIVHRDLKPDNVFLVANDDDEIAKVLDFGIAKTHRMDLAEGESTRTGSLVGTPFYMSPEQLRGMKTIDYRADIWSMGVIAYECLTGDRPFVSDSLGDLVLVVCTQPGPVPSQRHEVPSGFDAWFERATEKDPKARFSSAKELAKELTRLTGKLEEVSKEHDVSHVVTAKTGAPVPTAHSLATTSAPTPKDKKTLPISLLAFVATVGVGTAMFLWLNDRPRPPALELGATSAPVAESAESAAPAAVSREIPSASDPPDAVAPVALSASASATIAVTKAKLTPRGAPAVQPVASDKPKTPAAKPSGEVGVGF